MNISMYYYSIILLYLYIYDKESKRQNLHNVQMVCYLLTCFFCSWYLV